MGEMLSIKKENERFTAVDLRIYHVMYSTCTLLRILHFFTLCIKYFFYHTVECKQLVIV